MPDSATSTPNASQTPDGTSDRRISGSEAAGAQNTGFRYTAAENVPSWAVGRTAGEVAQLADQLYKQLLTQAPPAPPQPAAAPPPPAASAVLPTSDEWLQTPDIAGKKLADYIRKETIDPLAGQYGATLSQTARAVVELREPEAFKRWGPEIEMEVNRYMPDPRARTVDAIKTVVEMVRARHVDDLVEERVKARIASMQQNGATRADGASGAAASADSASRVDFNALPPVYADKLQQHRITEGTLREFFSLPSMRASFTGDENAPLQKCVDSWLEKAKKGDLITERGF